MAQAHTSSARKKDPKGGLTAAGREYFNKKEGSHLKKGVTGKADTPEKMRRKGSFLRRHFANPAGPMMKDGKPTRLALSAHAWGEPVPKTMAAAKKLAAKGTKLLERYDKWKEKQTTAGKRKTAKKKPATAKRKTTRKKTASASRKSASKKRASTTRKRKTTAKKR